MQLKILTHFKHTKTITDGTNGIIYCQFLVLICGRTDQIGLKIFSFR